MYRVNTDYITNNGLRATITSTSPLMGVVHKPDGRTTIHRWDDKGRHEGTRLSDRRSPLDLVGQWTDEPDDFLTGYVADLVSDVPGRPFVSPVYRTREALLRFLARNNLTAKLKRVVYVEEVDEVAA